MATKIVTKNSSTASAVPTASDLVQGELAVNVADKRLFTEDNAGAIVELGTNPSSNVTFQDNGKAIFGAGSDLQIYHDGSNSYIADEGSGFLVLKTGTTGLLVQNGSGQNVIQTGGNDVTLRYGSATKLATTSTGIDVTGTATMDRLGLGVAAHASAALNITTTDQHIRFNNGSELGIIELDSDGELNIWAHGDGETINLKTGSGAGTDVLSVVGGNVGIGSATINTFYDTAVNVYGAGNSVIQFQSSNTGTASGDGFAVGVLNGAATDAYVWNRESSNLLFGTSGGERMRLDASGNLLVGKTTQGLTNAGFEVAQTGQASATQSGASCLRLNRLSSDGEILQFRKDGTTVGSIGSSNSSSVTYLAGSASGGGIGVANNSPAVFPARPAGVIDNTINLGSGFYRFKDLYLSGNISTGIGAANANNYQIRVSAGTTGLSRFIAADTSDAGYIDYEHSSDSWIHRTAGAERMRIDSSGNVGIGTSSPSAKLEVVTASPTQSRFAYNSTNYVEVNYDGFNVVGGSMVFENAGSEKMRIDSSGNLLVGTSSSRTGTYSLSLEASNSLAYFRAAGAGSLSQIIFARNTDGSATTAGSISTTGTATAYNTSSDQRLKENIADADDAGSKVDAIQVRKFDWKADGSHQDYGMIAQELQAVAPEAVSGDADSEEMMGVDYSKLVPMLIKEIQSLRNRVAQLEE